MVSLPFACRIVNCTNAKKTRQVDGIYRTTFILGESHVLAIKKSPAFLQDSGEANQVSAQFVLTAIIIFCFPQSKDSSKELCAHFQCERQSSWEYQTSIYCSQRRSPQEILSPHR